MDERMLRGMYACGLHIKMIYWGFLKTFNAFQNIGGAPRDLVISNQNQLYLVQDDNKIYKLPLTPP